MGVAKSEAHRRLKAVKTRREAQAHAEGTDFEILTSLPTRHGEPEMAARAQLASLLTGPLAHDAGAADAGTFVAEVLRLSDLVARVEAEGENGAPVLHRCDRAPARLV